MHPGRLAARLEIANDHITSATAEIAALLSIPVPPTAPGMKRHALRDDPELRGMVSAERQAQLLETILAALIAKEKHVESYPTPADAGKNSRVRSGASVTA